MTIMIKQLRLLFASPIFPDEEKTRVAQILNRFVWSAISILSVVLMVRVILWVENGHEPLLILLVIIFILLGMQILIRRGYVRSASIFLAGSLWFAMTYQAWVADGIRDVATIAYLVIILLAALLLGWREGIFLGFLSLGALWYFGIQEAQGLRIQHMDAPLNIARDLTVIFVLAGLLIYLLINSLNRSLYDARLELKERLRADEKLQRQANYLTALNETALGLLNRSELQPLLESILTRACELSETQHGILELVLPDGSALQQELGLGVYANLNGMLTQKNIGVTGTVWATAQPVAVDDYSQWEHSIPVFVQAGFRAVMGVPLKLGDTVIGVLAFAYKEDGRLFSAEQIKLMERFAALASLAIDNARLYEQSQKEIHERSISEARTRAILTSIPDMIFEISKDGTFLDFMASAEIAPVMPASQFLGRNMKDLFPPAIAEQTVFALERTLATNQLHAFEYGMPPGEEVQFFEARITAISSESAIIMVRDISQRKYVEAEREKLINELEEKNGELERFTYTVSHDLKSPLITIKGFLGFLEQDAINGNITRLKADIKRIGDATQKMQSLLNELLELSRVGRLSNPYEDINFNQLATDVIELLHGRLNAHENQIVVDVQENLPIIYGDFPRLFEVLQNLVDNAAKFFGSQPHPRIEIGQNGFEDGKPIFYVKDNGVGIEPIHHDRIFGLFNKLDANSEGTGIGLALVKRIIETHGGRIWVESEVENGSTFFFTLPLKPES